MAATIVKGYTFGSTEQVTNTKLHNLVDQATISGIVNAEIDASAGIEATKLDTILTSNKVGGTSLFNLGSIVSGAGVIPNVNLDVDLTTLSPTDLSVLSLCSIQNLTVQTADINNGTMDGVNVDGATATGMLFVNDASDDLSQLGSQGTSGQVLQSAGAGANPTWADASGGAWELVEGGSFTGVDTAFDITSIGAAEGDIYMLVFNLTQQVSADALALKVNNGGSDYDSKMVGYQYTAAMGETDRTVTNNGSGSIPFSNYAGNLSQVNTDDNVYVSLKIWSFDGNSTKFTCWKGESHYMDNSTSGSAQWSYIDFAGKCHDASALDRLTLVNTNSGRHLGGDYALYKLKWT
jgi:hypothetical protein